MLNETTSKQLRDIIQEEIQNIMEKLTAQELDTDEKGVTTHTLKYDGSNAGVMRSLETPGGKLIQAYGRIRPTAPLKKDAVAVEETVKAPPSGDEESPDKEPEKKPSKKPRKKKDDRSKEDKSRDMGQIEMFEGKLTLSEWKAALTELLEGGDPYRDRNPNPEPLPGEVPQGGGGPIGYRGAPKSVAPTDPSRDRNPNPEPLPGEVPQGSGYHIEETSSNIPTSPEKWAKAKSAARSKFKVYPSAYANLWAAKKYKSMGGGWKKGKK